MQTKKLFARFLKHSLCLVQIFVLVLFVFNSVHAQTNQQRAVCSGSTLTLSAASFGLPNGTSFKWVSDVLAGNVSGNTNEASGNTTFAQTLSVTGNAQGIVQYTMTPSSGNPFLLTVTVNPIAMTVDASAVAPTICSGSNFYANISGVPAGTTYTWTVPTMSAGVGGGAAQATQQPYIVQPLTYSGGVGTQGTAIYTVTPYVGGCANPTFNFTVTVKPPSGTAPVVSNAGTVTPRCSGTSFTFNATANPSAGVSFSWTRPLAANISQAVGNGSNNAINEVLNNTGTQPAVAYYFYSLTYASGNCVNTAVVPVTINPIPVIAAKDTVNCSGAQFTIQINDLTPSDTRFTWPTPSVSAAVTGATAQATPVTVITQTLTNNPANRTTAVTVNYTVTPIAVSGAQSCAGAPFPVTVTLNPVSTTTSLSTTACSGQPFSFSTASFPPNTQFRWTLAPTITPSSAAITGGSAQTNPTTTISQVLTSTTTSVATATYVVTPQTGNCVGTNFNAVVTVNPTPSVTSNISRTVCSGATVTITNNGVPSNTLYSWTIPTVTPANSTSGQTALVSQAAFSQTLTNLTNAPSTASYTVVPVAGSCAGSPFTIDVLVNPTPNISNQSVASCSGASFQINPNNVPDGTTYTWTIPAMDAFVSGGSAQNAQQSSISQTLFNNGNTNATAVYTITPRANSCTGASFNATVTVKPLPIAANYTSSSCSGSSFISSPTSSQTGTLYTWSLPVSTTPGIITGGTAQEIPQTSISNVLNNTSNSAATILYSITPIVAGCVGNSFTLTHTVLPTPVIAAVKTEVCSQAPMSVAIPNVPFGTTYSWSAPAISPASAISGATAQSSPISVINQVLTNQNNTNAVALYTVTPNTGVCIGPSFALEVTVKVAASPVNQAITICSGQSFDVKPSGVPSGTSYTWSTPVRGADVNGGNAENNSQTSIVQTLQYTGAGNTNGNASYTVTPTTNGCVGSSFQLSVTIRPLPIVADISQSVCSGSAFSITPNSSVANTLFTWGDPVISPASSVNGALSRNSAVQQIGQTLINNTNAPATVSYTITPVANGCTGNSFLLIQTVKPTPNISTQQTKICSNTAFNVAPTNVPIGTATLYTWSAPVINPTGSITGSGAQNIPVTVINQTLTNTGIAVATATYDVLPISDGCQGQSFKVIVAVTPRARPANLTTSVCSGSSFSVTPDNVPAGTQYIWTEPMITNGILGGAAQLIPQNSIGQQLTNSNITNATGTATYMVTPITDGCTGTNFTIAVTINSSNANLNSTLTPAPVCSGSTFSYTPTSTVSGTAFAWTRNAVAGIGNSAVNSFGVINEVLNNTTDGPVQVTYIFTLSTNGCTNLNKQSITVTVNPAPKLSSTITPPAICSGTMINYTATSNTQNVVFNWERTFVVGVEQPVTTGTGNINEVLSNSTLSTVTIPYNFTLIAAGCSNQQTVFVTVNPVLTVPDQSIATCSNSSFSYKAPNTPANTVYTWTTLQLSAGVSGGTQQTLVAQNSVTQILSNNTNAPGTATYQVTPIIPATFSTGCIGRPFALTVAVNPVPVLTSTLSPPGICSGSEFQYTPTSNLPGTGFTWIREQMSGISNVRSSGNGGIKEILFDTLTTPVKVSYKYTLSAFGCQDTSGIVQLTVQASPVLKTQQFTICSGTAFNLSNDLLPARTTYTWTSPVVVPTSAIKGFTQSKEAVSVFGDTLYNLTTNAATATYIVQPIGDICSIASFQAVVTVKPRPEISNQVLSICSGTNLSYTPSNIPADTKFTWNLPVITPFGRLSGTTNELQGNSSINQRIFNLGKDTANALYTVSPVSNGCAGPTFQLKVTVNAIPDVRIQAPAALCRNVNDTLKAIFTGQSPWTIVYTDSRNGLPVTMKNITQQEQSIVLNNLPDTANFQFRVLSVRDQYCTNDTSTVTIQQLLYPLPYDSVVAPEGTQLCVGKTLPLNVNATRGNYFWYRNDTIQGATINNGFQVRQPGVYRAATTNEFGCTNKTLNSLSYQFVFDNPTLLFSFDQSCEKTPINFINKTDTSRTGSIEWKWIFNNKDSTTGFKSTYSFSKDGAQLVQLKGTSLYCGTSFTKDSLVLIRKPEPSTRLATVYTYQNKATQLQARKPSGINYQYKWVPSFGLNNGNIDNPMFNFNINQQYLIQLISPQGCITNDTLQVHVFEQSLVEIFVPKSFSPNGDGMNDLLYAYPAGIKELRYFRIYNKAGALLFQTRNLSEPWDGRYNGAPQPLGVYAWVAEAFDQNGKLIQQQGTFLLLR